MLTVCNIVVQYYVISPQQGCEDCVLEINVSKTKELILSSNAQDTPDELQRLTVTGSPGEIICS